MTATGTIAKGGLRNAIEEGSKSQQKACTRSVTPHATTQAFNGHTRRELTRHRQTDRRIIDELVDCPRFTGR